jgi:hypothetical protein
MRMERRHPGIRSGADGFEARFGKSSNDGGINDWQSVSGRLNDMPEIYGPASPGTRL